ncbi:MAG: SAM-dependent methyltransferase [Streptosporangiaceae bacterium]
MGSDGGGVDAGAGDGAPYAPYTPVIDTSVAHPARIYDYWLGGKDNFAADREAGELALRAYPELAQAVQSNRAFLARAVRYLTGEAGLRQFLDIGTGIPSASNTHEVAQQEAPDTKIVYVDNDHCKSGCAHAR